MNATFFPSKKAFEIALKNIPDDNDSFKTKLNEFSKEIKKLCELEDIAKFYDETISLLPTLYFNIPACIPTSKQK